jgi:hypothetical protein
MKIFSLVAASLTVISSPAMAADLVGSSVAFSHVSGGSASATDTKTVANGTSDLATLALTAGRGYTVNLDAGSLTVDFFAPQSPSFASSLAAFPTPNPYAFGNTTPLGLVLSSTTFDFSSILSSLTISTSNNFSFSKARITQYGGTGLLFSFAGMSYSDTSGFTATFTAPSMASAAPEPATWAMLIVGFGMAGAAMRRRRITGLATA